MSKIQVINVVDRGNGVLKITCFVKRWYWPSVLKAYEGFPNNWLTPDLKELPSPRVEKELNIEYNLHYSRKPKVEGK